MFWFEDFILPTCNSGNYIEAWLIFLVTLSPSVCEKSNLKECWTLEYQLKLNEAIISCNRIYTFIAQKEYIHLLIWQKYIYLPYISYRDVMTICYICVMCSIQKGVIKLDGKSQSS